MGPVSEAGDDAAVYAEDLRRDIGVAPGGAGGMSAVAVGVPGRVVQLWADERVVQRSHVAGTDQFVVALERDVIRIVRGVAEIASGKDYFVLRIGIDVDVLD